VGEGKERVKRVEGGGGKDFKSRDRREGKVGREGFSRVGVEKKE
jgi:hypothetical protein